jgi:biopolymer transport protein ExbD
MARFKKKGKNELPAINTGSMSDIIFMFLFFFMVITTIRETTLYIRVRVPQATEVQKLEKKSLVSYIYIGPPLKSKLGTESRIQLNDQISTVGDIQQFITEERESRDEADRKLLTTSLKVDRDTRMGIVSDVKQQLRKIGAFKINYSASKKKEK